MKPIKPLFGILLLLALPVVVQAQFAYVTNNGTITITRYTGYGSGGDVTIPSTTNGLPVTSVGAFAFENNLEVTNVTIPYSITNIAALAFAPMANSPLRTLTVDTNNPAYCSLDGVLFNKSQTVLVVFPAGRPGGYIISNSVTNIGDGAFYYCHGLLGVDIPNSVASIGDEAFDFCASLTNVTIPNGVVNIGNLAFASCTGLTNFTIPNRVTSIGSSSFGGCSNLIAIKVDALNPAYSSLDGILFNKTQTTIVGFPPGRGGTYTVPSSVTTIGTSAFSSCGSLTNITIPNSVTNVGKGAFASCGSLTSVTIPNSVTVIETGAFEFCTSLTSTTIGNNVIGIGGGAFYYCPSLTEVYFKGDAPEADLSVFDLDNDATIYYLSGTMGWEPTFAGRPTALWVLPNPLILSSGASFGVQTNKFGFIVSWATNVLVVVDACTNLANPVWSPLQTNALTNGSIYFSDPGWTNYPARFYRIRSP